MKASRLLMPTLRQVPAEAEIASHQLMLRAGLMRKLASGIYSFLPLGLKAFKKVENIIREEMDNSGAQELIMSALLPSEIYIESGRWEVFGPEMFRLQDRGGRDFCLGPTHEEVFTTTVRNEIKSYKALPVTLYQIQTKYRDEIRPRFGVMRCREFVMKDAYSFDRNEEGLDQSYQAMRDAYCKIFDRCKLDYSIVQADSGAMGGSGSEEFMVKSDIGEATLAFCNDCGYAANDEKAQCKPVPEENNDPYYTMEKESTPDVKTIEDLEKFFNCKSSQFGKTLLYQADDQVVAVMVRGDRDVNETKLKNYLRCADLALADEETVVKATSAQVGFAGPVGLKVRLIVDLEIPEMKNFIIGANDTGYHYKNANFGRDFETKEIVDLRNITEGDACPVCGGKINIAQGIEVGHIFKLGTKYSEALNCRFLDENGKEQPVIMGSYGIGVGRTLASIIEQNHDENGIVWPVSVAPYHVIIVTVNNADEQQMALSEKIYKDLQAKGIEVLWDERNERPGVKFKDADLIGYPVRLTVGKKASEGIVEYKLRKEEHYTDMSVEDALAAAVAFVKGI